MHIEKQSEKRGFSLDANILTLSNIACGLLAVVSGIVIGFWHPSKHRKGKPHRRPARPPKPHNARLARTAGIIGSVFAIGKAILSQVELGNIVKDVKEQYPEIEIENAIPIGSEEEVYEYVNQNEV